MYIVNITNISIISEQGAVSTRSNNRGSIVLRKTFYATLYQSCKDFLDFAFFFFFLSFPDNIRLKHQQIEECDYYLRYGGFVLLSGHFR